MYSLHDITRTCVKLENPDTTFRVENLQDSAPVPSPTVKMEKKDTVCELKIHQVMSGNQVVIENGIPVRGVTSPISLSTQQHMPSSQVPPHSRPSPMQMNDHSEQISSNKVESKLSCGIVAAVDGQVYQIASGYEPETQIAPMSPLYQSVSVDRCRENVSVSTQPSNAQTTTCQTEGSNWNHRYQAAMPSPEIGSIHGGRLGYRLLSRDAKASAQIGPGEGLSTEQGTVLSSNETPNQEVSGKQVNARDGDSANFSGNQEISPHQILESNQVDTNVEMLSYRISTQNGMIPHQMGPSYETANHNPGVSQGMSGHQIGTGGSLPLEINTMNRMLPQSKPRDGMQGHQMMSSEEVQNSKQAETQLNRSSDQMALWSQDRSPYPRRNGMSAYSAGAHRAMSGYHVGSYAHKMSSEDGTSFKTYDVHGNLPPPYEMESYGGIPSYRRLSHDSMLPYPATNYDKVPSYPTGFQENGTHERMEFFQIDSRAMQQNNGHTCHCSCHLSLPPRSSHFPAFGLESQRPSVIMVPFAKNGMVSCTPQLHSKREDQDLQFKQPQLNHEMNYSDDSDSSDGGDGEGQREKYFRKSLDGTTAKFKLSKEDWKRIPINTFPSGGRLLSGDWTRIFLSKVKESNPWCSLRFKNNHVRSENSRKIHSAVFFRGGAECKRPECNVKVRFVIRKEKGKYVDVTYVGDVCHSSQPGGSDGTKEKKRAKRARRPGLWSE